MNDDEVTRLMEAPQPLAVGVARAPHVARSAPPVHLAPTPSVGIASMGHTHFGDTNCAVKGPDLCGDEPAPDSAPADDSTERQAKFGERSSTVTSLRRRFWNSLRVTRRLRRARDARWGAEISRGMSLGLGAVIGIGGALLLLLPRATAGKPPPEETRFERALPAAPVPNAGREDGNKRESPPPTPDETAAKSLQAMNAWSAGDCRRAVQLYRELRQGSRGGVSSTWRVFETNASLMCRVGQISSVAKEPK